MTDLDDSSELQGFATIPRWLQRDQTVSWQAKMTYLTLSSYSDKFGHSYPSHATIAEQVPCSVTAVKNALKELRKLGVVTWSQRATGDNGQTSNMYQISTTLPVDNSADPLGVVRLPPRHQSDPLGVVRLPPRRGTPTNESQINEDIKSLPSITSSGAVDNFQADRPIPHPSRKTAGINRTALMANVAVVFAGTDITDDQIFTIATEILDRAPSRVLDPTAYVIASIRNDAIEWQAHAYSLEASQRLLGGNSW